MSLVVPLISAIEEFLVRVDKAGARVDTIWAPVWRMRYRPGLDAKLSEKSDRLGATATTCAFVALGAVPSAAPPSAPFAEHEAPFAEH